MNVSVNNLCTNVSFFPVWVILFFRALHPSCNDSEGFVGGKFA